MRDTGNCKWDESQIKRRFRREGAEMHGDKCCTDLRPTNRTHLYVEESAGSTAFRFGYSGSRSRLLRLFWD
jgi:hypothetical protein